jgi:hypothetical protein
MHKQANSLLEKQMIFAFYLILAVISYLMLNSVVSEQSYLEDYFVRDLGLTIDLSYSSPGNLELEYSNLDRINLVVKENLIKIKSEKDAIQKIYQIVKDRNYNELNLEINLALDSPLKINQEKNKLFFEKVNKK